ncbi:MAG: hypothetical protein V1874_08000 [Spirochaetota bacterium]
MKKYAFLLFAAAVLFLSCKSLPVIEHPGRYKEHMAAGFYLKDKYQLTHSIKAELPNGDRLLLIGVTSVDPAQRSIRAVMMSVEGLVLLDASLGNNAVTVNRAIPAFESSDFVKALMDDLKLIYFAPEARSPVYGKQPDGKSIARFGCADGTTIDVITQGGETKINKYDSSYGLTRTVNIMQLNSKGLPQRLELVAHGLFGYTLFLELISFEKM